MKNIVETELLNPILKKLFYQLLGCISPAVMGIVFSSSTAKSYILSESPKWLSNLLTTGWIQIVLIVIGAVLIPSFTYFIIEYCDQRKKKTGYGILLNLISNIDNVVQHKRQRFKTIKENKPKSDSVIFRKITQPIEQISCLCQALCFMMRFLTNDENIKSSIFCCCKGKIERCLAVCGEDTMRSNLSELNSRSLAKVVLEKGEPVLSNDVSKNEEFHKPRGCRTKSICIFPIYEGSQILFILCFSSCKKGTFNHEQLDKYEKIIEEFSDRIMLEWHLLELTQK